MQSYCGLAAERVGNDRPYFSVIANYSKAGNKRSIKANADITISEAFRSPDSHNGRLIRRSKRHGRRLSRRPAWREDQAT